MTSICASTIAPRAAIITFCGGNKKSTCLPGKNAMPFYFPMQQKKHSPRIKRFVFLKLPQTCPPLFLQGASLLTKDAFYDGGY